MIGRVSVPALPPALPRALLGLAVSMVLTGPAGAVEVDIELGLYNRFTVEADHVEDLVLFDTAAGEYALDRYLSLSRDDIYHSLVVRAGLGLTLTDWLDVTLDVEVTANRGDLLSHAGIARELASEGEGRVVLPEIPGAPEVEFTYVEGAPAVEVGGVSIRIDDPDNGVYLPRDCRFIPHEKMPDAANHAKLHTDEYYINVTNILNTATSELECRVALKLIAKKLREGTLEY